MYTHTNVYIYVYIHVFVCVCVYVCVCVCVFVCATHCNTLQYCGPVHELLAGSLQRLDALAAFIDLHCSEALADRLQRLDALAMHINSRIIDQAQQSQNTRGETAHTKDLEKQSTLAPLKAFAEWQRKRAGREQVWERDWERYLLRK